MKRGKTLEGNVMKNIFQAFFTLTFLFTSSQTLAYSQAPNSLASLVNQEIIKTQNAIRSVSLRIKLDDTLHGIVESKTCSFCKTIKINITPNTKAYANNINVPLKQAMNRFGRNATVIYDLKTNNISAIRWHN